MTTPTLLVIDSLNLADAERQLCLAALEAGGSIVEAAKLLGITRHALKRRMLKHRLGPASAGPRCSRP